MEVRAAISSGDFSTAARTLNRALGRCPASASVLEWAARLELGREQFERALDLTDRLAKVRKPPLASDLVLRAQVLYLLARDAEAQRTFEEAVDRYPADVEARYALGRFHYQFQRFEQAAAQFQAVVDRHPDAYRAWDNLGLAQEGLGARDKAMKSYLRALELVSKDHPEYDRVYVNLANFLIAGDQARRAFDLAVAAAERNPNSAQTFFIAGKALVHLEQFDKSIRWLKRSIELDPTSPEPHYVLARAYSRLGQKDASTAELAEFKRLREQQPDRRR